MTSDKRAMLHALFVAEQNCILTHIAWSENECDETGDAHDKACIERDALTRAYFECDETDLYALAELRTQAFTQHEYSVSVDDRGEIIVT